jgi:stage V sporulation protein B
LLPIAYTSAQRGAVQGLQKQSYLAGADVAEVLCRIPATLLLVIWLAPKGVAWAAAGVAAGYIIGELASALVLHYALQSKKATRVRRKAPKLQPRPLLALSLPLMATNLLNNMMSLITVALIPRLLQSAGYTATAATRAYGRLSGMAIPALYMPMMLVYPVVSVALPEITRLATQKSARATQRLQWLLQRVFLGTAVVTVIVAPLLWYQGDKIALILYGDATVGELIRPLALSVPFTFFGSVISGVLYGFGKTSWTMLSSIAGNLLRILLVYTLAGQPEWGIMGVLWAVIADNALTALLAGVGLLWIFARRNSKR